MTPEQSHTPEPVSFLVFSGSLRAGSLNTRLAALAVGRHPQISPQSSRPRARPISASRRASSASASSGS